MRMAASVTARDDQAHAAYQGVERDQLGQFVRLMGRRIGVEAGGQRDVLVIVRFELGDFRLTARISDLRLLCEPRRSERGQAADDRAREEAADRSDRPGGGP